MTGDDVYVYPLGPDTLTVTCAPTEAVPNTAACRGSRWSTMWSLKLPLNSTLVRSKGGSWGSGEATAVGMPQASAMRR